MPEEFEGTVTIEWPSDPHPLPGWRATIRTDETGIPISTATEITVHAKADGIVWVELELFTDMWGQPVYGGPASVVRRVAIGDDGEPLTAVFPFLVASMSVRELAGVAPQ
jgi:hypothetical protein